MGVGDWGGRGQVPIFYLLDDWSIHVVEDSRYLFVAPRFRGRDRSWIVAYDRTDESAGRAGDRTAVEGSGRVGSRTGTARRKVRRGVCFG